MAHDSSEKLSASLPRAFNDYFSFSRGKNATSFKQIITSTRLNNLLKVKNSIVEGKEEIKVRLIARLVNIIIAWGASICSAFCRNSLKLHPRAMNHTVGWTLSWKWDHLSLPSCASSKFHLDHRLEFQRERFSQWYFIDGKQSCTRRRASRFFKAFNSFSQKCHFSSGFAECRHQAMHFET